MKNFRIWVVLLVAVTAISSCSEGIKSDITHLPFKNSQDSKWGLVSTDGKVLFAEQFANMPSVAVNGIFTVKNSAGLYEYYNASETPQKFGGEYIQAGLFHENLAPVVLSESPVSFIDKTGKTAFELKEFEGVKIVAATNFSDGMAMVENATGLKGYINTAGEFIIKPQYEVALPFNAGLALVGKKTSEGTIYTLMNKSGQTTATLDTRIVAIHEYFSESLAGYTMSEEMDEWGFIDISGNIVIPADSLRKAVKPFCGKYAIFWDGMLWGAINRKGEVVINPIYASLEYGPEGKFIAGDGEKFNLIDLNLKRLGIENFSSHTGYINGYAFIGEPGRFVSANKSGKQNGEATYFEVANPSINELFESDIFSISGEIRKFISIIAQDRIGNIRFGQTAEATASQMGYPSPEIAKGMRRFSKSIDGKDIKGSMFAEFSDNPVIEITEKQMSRDMWGKAFYEDVVTGYSFNEEATLSDIGYIMHLSGQFKGKEKPITGILASMAKSSGFKIVTEKEDELIFSSESETNLHIIIKQGGIEIRGSR